MVGGGNRQLIPELMTKLLYQYVYIFACYVKDHQNIWLLPQEIALHFLFKDHDSSISLHLDGSKPVRSAYFYSLGRENSQGYDTLDKDYYIYRWTEHSADYFQMSTGGWKEGPKITPLGWIFWTMIFYNLEKFTSRSI